MANEKRLIDAKEGKKRFCAIAQPAEYKGVIHLVVPISEIDKLPTVDAVEVVHGYTTIADNPTKVLLDRKCSICDQLMLATDNFCPMCGAKNEGEKIDGLMFADMEEIIDA